MPDDSTLQAAPYTAWPTADDVLQRLASIGLTPRGGTDAGTGATGRIQAIAASVTAEVAHRTRRQFVADTVATSHTYDGSGTAELQIDPILSITQVQIVGGFGTPSYLYDLSSVQTIAEQGKPQTRLVVGRGSLPAWATAAVETAVYYLFPAGRQNIVVTGLFGYGASIPADLWEAVCGEIALRLTRETLFTASGRVTDEAYGDERRKYALPEAEATGWADAYQKALCDYKHPSGAALRKRRSPMI